MASDNVITHIDPPKSREQLALLLMRWNALNKLGIQPQDHNPEMLHLTAMLKNVAQQQREFEERQAKLASINSESGSENRDLRPQLAAYKMLSRGLDIPSHIRSELTKAAPGCLIEEEHTETQDLESRLHKLVPLPTQLPETIIRNRLAHRVVELERLSSNLGTVDATKADLIAPDELHDECDELKFKALIELKSLRLLTKQKSMRQHVVYNHAATDSQSTYGQSMLLRSMNRRLKVSAAQELQITDEIAKKVQHEREQIAKHSLIELINASLKNSSRFKQHIDQRQLRKAALVKHLTQFHAQVEREESKRAERTAKQRLQALRSNDEEAYIKLLDQTKDTRITHLLRQTNQFLASLSEAVRVQQAESGALQPTESELEKIDYYEVAHRVKEPVTEQASILVGGTLKEYQLKGTEWMISLVNNNLNGILADEMGLGKTIQSISLITYLIDKKRWPGPFLVIVPLSTITNWTVELEKWAPSVRKVVYKGPPAARKAQQAIVRSGDFQVLLTTYEYVIKDRPLLSKIRWQHMIIDEGHRMKNTQSKLSSTLVNHYHSRNRLILTGTPLQNNLPELWALLNFVLPKIFNSQKTFDEWFNTPFANTGGQDKMELTEEETLLIIRRLHKVLRPFLLRRLKKDVEKDLPDKVETVIKCKMSALQRVLYDQMLKYNVIYTGSGANADGSKVNSGLRSLNNKIMQLRKICNHPYVFQEVEQVVDPTTVNYDLLWRTAGKFELLDRILPKFKAKNHRVLIFFQMTQIMDIMEDYLRYRGIQYLRLDGSTKADERSEKLQVFNAPDSPYFCFLLSTRAGGLGLNLQTADTVIIYDTDWNPFQDLQAQDRAHRIGQTKEVRILRLITERSIEEAILDRAVSKLEIDGKVIQAGKFDNKSTNEEQEAFLRNLMEAEESRRDSKDQEDEEMDDFELNQILARGDEEVEFFNKLDEERVEKENADGVVRLFSQAELPEIYQEDLAERFKEPEVVETTRRERRHTLYDDEDWLRYEVMDDAGSDQSDEGDDPAEFDGSEAAEEDSKKSKNKERGKRKSSKVGRPKRSRTNLNPKDREKLNSQILKTIELIESQTADNPPRSRSGIFVELPSKRDYPDYYKIITAPISLKEIRKKLKSNSYISFSEAKDDLMLMLNNARTYNMEGSVVYDDANFLAKLVEDA